MGIYEYLILSIDERANLLWATGVFLETYATKETTCKLFSLESFFVEVVIDNADGKIKEVTPFLRGERLEKYLKKISVEEFL